MEHKRITIIAGHYGSGKTNFAVNLALTLKKSEKNVVVADADIVNPYFRTKDCEETLNKAGIRLICSKYANSNVDIPALPQELYSITDDKDICAIMDIGGDDRGAYALARFTPAITEENNYDMLAVINKYRPLTSEVQPTIEILREIEAASKLKFTGIINNSNIGRDTTADDVIKSKKYANEIAGTMGIPIKLTCVKEELYEELKGEFSDLLPLKLQYIIN